jgi:hypothetical protein
MQLGDSDVLCESCRVVSDCVFTYRIVYVIISYRGSAQYTFFIVQFCLSSELVLGCSLL